MVMRLLGIHILSLILLVWFTTQAIAQVSTCAITGNLVFLYGGVAANQKIWFTYGEPQNTILGTVIPGGQRVMVQTDVNGNLPTAGGCLPTGTQFCPPQGAYFYMQIGSGPTTRRLQAPLMSTVNINQLILENNDPVAVVTDVESANSNCTVQNPPVGTAGTSTITCMGSGGPSGGTGIVGFAPANVAGIGTFTNNAITTASYCNCRDSVTNSNTCYTNNPVAGSVGFVTNSNDIAQVSCSGNVVTASANIANYTGAVGITGNSGGGTDFENQVCHDGVCPITAFGAKCDGVTDDTAAFNAAITAAQATSPTFQTTILVPFTANGCLLNSLINIANTGHPSGPSITGTSSAQPGYIKINNATGGFKCSGNVVPACSLRNLRFDAANAGSDIGYAIKIEATSQASVQDVMLNSTGYAHKFTDGLWLAGAERTSVNNIYSAHNGIAVLFSYDTTHNIGGNQNVLSNINSLADVTCLDSEPDSGENTVTGLSCEVASGTGVIQHNTSTGYNRDNLILISPEFEQNTGTWDIDVQSGGVQIYQLIMFAGPGMHISSSGFASVNTGAIGTVGAPVPVVQIDASPVAPTTFQNVVMSNTLTNNATSNLYGFGNSGTGAIPNLWPRGTSTFAARPACNAGYKGLSWTFIGDVTTCTFNTTVTGSGAINCPATCDGTNWVGG